MRSLFLLGLVVVAALLLRGCACAVAVACDSASDCVTGTVCSSNGACIDQGGLQDEAEGEGEGEGEGDEGAAPTVYATSPLDGANDVSIGTVPTATFSNAMAPATITFTVNEGSTPVVGTVTYDDATNSARFTPEAPLENGLVYAATISEAVDSAGVALLVGFTWSFTTVVDDVPPTVVSTNPLNGASSVSVNAKPTATFSTAMDPTTITASTFTVKQGSASVLGAVTLNGNTATFTPAAPLGFNLEYTGTITTEASNTNNTFLGADFVWSFTTPPCGQAPINLRSAANFAVLASTTVTNAGETSITGDLGLNPGTSVTGFPPGILVGTRHVADATSAAGIADLTTAFNDAAGRTLCPTSVAGNIGEQTLFPGLYKSTSSLAVSAGDLTLDAQGDGDGVFVFQMASTLTITAGRRVILTGGAKSANVFWQVGSAAVLEGTCEVQGTIMAEVSVTVAAGATIDGRALARTAEVTLAANTIVKPAP